MPMTPADAARLDDYSFQHGYDAGNMAFMLDQLTDAMSLPANTRSIAASRKAHELGNRHWTWCRSTNCCRRRRI